MGTRFSRILGIDFGLKRVGLAMTDPGGVLASPYATLERTTREQCFADIKRIIETEGVRRVVVGLPLGLDGRETETTRQAKNFADSLARRVSVPVELFDERLTSAQAEAELTEAGLTCPKKKKQALDSQAATIILRSWMDAG